MKPGPKPGTYTPSKETREKMRQAKLGRKHNQETRSRIRESKLAASSDKKFLNRFEEMRAEYPEEDDFFNKNKLELLGIMEDVRSERELVQLRKHVEISRVDSNTSYNYPSTSIFAVEDLLIDLIDFKRELFKNITSIDKINLSG